MNEIAHPNRGLIGQADALMSLQTPVLVVDALALQRNIDRMAAFATAQSVALRPHVKTHKCVAIARLQHAAGAIGFCTATLGEAEPLLEAGLDDILITSPAIGAGKIDRLIALRRRSARVAIVVDSLSNLSALANAMAAASLTLDVFIALDIGSHRIGARTPADALRLAQAVDAATHLRLAGVHAYAGMIQHIEPHDGRAAAAVVARQVLDELLQLFRDHGLRVDTVSGAGTGTYEIDGRAGRYTELQVGSYCLMDVEYGRVALSEDSTGPFEQSLWVLTRVISANHPGFVTTDAGTKRFAMGGALPEVGAGAPAGSVYGFQGDEHGTITFARPGESLPIESLVWIRPPHCDPTVNLYDAIHVVENGKLVDLWPIEGRGAI